MSSQTAGSVDISYDYEQQALRLLEVPSELLSSLSAASPPILSLKSTSSHSSSAVFLCTTDSTYEVKQVSSSNTLLLIRPADKKNPEEPPAPSMMVFAKCAGMLELLSLNINSDGFRTPKQCLSDLLPLYARDTDALNVGPSSASRCELFASIPFSDAELQHAWEELAAFELGPGSYRPTAGACVAVWSALIISATAMGIDLTTPTSFQELKALAADCPVPLLVSLCSRVGSQTQDHAILLDQRKMVSVTAEYAVQDALGKRQQGHASLLETWHAMIPDQWRANATGSLLEAMPQYRLLASSQGVPFSGSVSGSSDAKRKPAAARNWHDKFKQTKS